MKVILTREWMGRGKGDEVNLIDQVANQLIERGTAKLPENERKTTFRGKRKHRMMKESPVEKELETPHTG